MHRTESHARRTKPDRLAGMKRRFALVAGPAAALGGAALIASLTSCQTPAALTPMPEPLNQQKLVYVEQGWTAADRQTYYHTPQGTQILPYDWVMALEQVTSTEPFMSQENVSRYRFLADTADTKDNPDHLPVGVTKDVGPSEDNPQKTVAYFGLTCAACHTGQIHYKGTAIRIDGGAAQHDLTSFVASMILALEFTTKDPLKFDRFAQKVLGTGATLEAKLALNREVNAAAMKLIENDFVHRSLYPTKDGFGRQDALGRGGNNGLSRIGIESNLIVADAPVSYPAVWDALNWNWVQYNTSIQQPLGRNIGEVLGVGGWATLKSSKPDKSDLYESSVKLPELQQIEATVRRLKAPRWPEEILGPIDPVRRQRGEALFAARCADCHDHHQMDELGDYKVRIIPLEMIGTDPGQAVNIKHHVIDPGDLRLPTDGPRISVGAALQRITENVANRKLAELYPDETLRAAKKAEMSYGRSDNWRDAVPVTESDGTVVKVMGYRAHSLRSIWATPPYLHNGSVPNIYELLSPVEERSKEFYTGNLEYDPQHLGYQTGSFESGFKFSVNEPGNSNAGHEFTNTAKGGGVVGRYLEPSERLDLIEYLKSR